MALMILSWDMPPAEQTEAYNEQASTVWIPTILGVPGVTEFRAYRNPLGTTPGVCVHTEFDSLASWLAYTESEAYTTIMSGLRGVGCTNLSSEIWGSSPIVPKPLKPASG